MIRFSKFVQIVFITFFITSIYADSFEDVLYEWTGHMDYQRFTEADEAYLKLNKI